VETNYVQSITQNSAFSGGVIISDNGSAITSRGVCWSTLPNPTTADFFSVNGAGVGSFTSNVTGLTQNQVYFIRAYATNEYGTSYGNQFSFSTSKFYTAGDIGPAGGVVFYDKGYYSFGWRYLEVAPSGWNGASSDPLGSFWGCIGDTIAGSNGTSIGSGFQNTFDILQQCSTDGIAAKICNDATINGFSDWFLASWSEMSQLFSLFNETWFNDLSMSSNHIYWTSTESSANDAKTITVGSGYIQQVTPKNSSSRRVRPIRSF
jgi:hypothetical protein